MKIGVCESHCRPGRADENARRYRRTDFVGATAQTIIGVLKVVLAAGAGENRRLNACRRNQIG